MGASTTHEKFSLWQKLGYGLGTGGVVVMMYAIFPDIPDADELKSGERRERIFSAQVTFIRKVSSALAIIAISQAIGWAGYVRPVETAVDGAARLVEQPQTLTFLLVLRLIFMLLPVVLLVFTLYFANRYPLTPPLHARLNTYLARRREVDPQDLSVQEQAEQTALRAALCDFGRAE